MTEANSNPDADVIGFNAAYTIATAGLHLTNVATIDGSTVPGYAGTPLVRVVATGAINTFQISGTAAGSIIDALIITGPAQSQVYFSTTGTVKRSYIGAVTGAPGETGATQNGIFVASPTVDVIDCVIGGNTGEGIVVFGWTRINGCIIGLRPDGVTPAPNTLHGIYVADTAWIGDTARNIISANGVDGINSELSTPAMSANGPWIRGNYIGTDITGLLDRGNGRHGVLMNGDHTLTEDNVISGNGVHGVLSDLPTRHILAFVEGNIIGLGSDGSTVIENGLDGVHLTGNNIRVGGNTAAERNIISGNARAGIFIDSGSVAHSINRNYIGTDVTGTLDRGNAEEGIYSEGRFLMGSNVVSGNDGPAGVALVDPGWASLAGNIIGLDATGNVPLPNSNDGVVVTSNDSFGVRIGGDFAGAMNVISGNGGAGVSVWGSNTQVSSSHIGTDITGLLARPNGTDGVQLNVCSNITVGGATAFTRNILSGNGAAGVRINSAAQSNFVQGNYIGTDISGAAPLPNSGDGVAIAGSGPSNNLIGGTAAGTANVISGNIANGIRFSATSTNDVRIEGNVIGRAADAITPLGNAGAGILVDGTSGLTGNFIGGSTPGAGNLIANNAVSGVVIAPTSQKNRITRNSITANAGLGIDLLPLPGVTPNDAGDPDTGGNLLQNFPVLTGAYLYPGPNGRATGTLNSTPSTTFTLEFFANAAGDPEGAIYLGDAVIMTDGSGNATFDAPLANAPGPGQVVTATAIAPFHNTSEFSAELAVTTPGVLSFDSATYLVGEAGTSIMLTVNRTGGSDGTVTAVATPGGGTAETTDYDPTPQTLTFGPGVVTQTLTITITDDPIDEIDETFDVSLGTFTGGAIAGSPSTATVTMTDSDTTPSITIADVPASEADANVTFTVTLSNPSESTITVDYATSDGTATAGVDYTAVSGTATILAGNLTTTIDVPILGDTTFESDETVNITLTSPVNATISDGTAVGTITNDDPAPSASIDDPSVAEVDAGTSVLLFTVTLSNPSVNTVTVNYASSDGTATAPDDYTAVSGTLTFDPGVVSQTINVLVASDLIDEGDETVVMTLSDGTITDGSGTGTIVDDDDPPVISIDDAGAGEGDVGSTPATFLVTLSHPSAFAITVDYATGGGTATPGTDYTATSGTLTFAPLETSKPLPVSVLGDEITEPNETFEVTLSNPTMASILDGTGLGTITDDEAAPAISIAPTSASEAAASLEFTVTLSNASSQNVTVDYSTTGGTATSGVDFTPVSGTLTINAGLLSGTITVPILADNTFETDETMTVTLTNPANGSLSTATATGTITNDDAQPAIEVIPTSASEAAAGLVFTVALSNPSAQNITVDYSTTGLTATSGVDFTPVTGTLTINAGMLSGTITVPIIADNIFESDETMAVTLTNPGNATISAATATGTITNDDEPPTITIDNPSASESSASLSFTITLSSPSSQTITVDWTTADGTATAGNDYTAASGTATFAPNTTTQTVDVTLLGDSITEGSETLNVNLANAVNASFADPSGMGTIFDDESAPNIIIDNASAGEGAGTISLTVTLSNASAVPVTVDWANSPGTADGSTDYTPSSGTLTFNPGETTQTIVINLGANDATFESDETFTVTLSNATNAVIFDGSAVATITNDDPPPTITIDDATASENGALTFAVRLSQPSGVTVTVQWSTGGGDATAGADYAPSSGTVTFLAGDTEESVVVSVVDDAAVEPAETVDVTLTNPTGATIADGSATGTILDNDTATAANDIPTLSEWMLMLLAAFLAVAAVRSSRLA